MTFLDVSFLARTKELIYKYGKTVTFTIVPVDSDGSGYDPATDEITDAAPVTVTTKCIIGLSSKGGGGKQHSVDMAQGGSATTIESSRLLYVPAKDFAVSPKPGDTVTLDAAVWTVLLADPFYSGEQASLYGVLVKS